MKCPCCNKSLKLAPYVFYNVTKYNKSAIATTECCGKLIKVYPHLSITVKPYEGNKTEDDWGVPQKQKDH